MVPACLSHSIDRILPQAAALSTSRLKPQGGAAAFFWPVLSVLCRVLCIISALRMLGCICTGALSMITYHCCKLRYSVLSADVLS